VSEPKVGALCGNAARRDLRGGWRATAIPTATLSVRYGTVAKLNFKARLVNLETL
jgi:hypothetical protein